MAVAFQQQIFALDARFNAYRAPGNPNFKTLYIRRRSQLLRENSKFKDIDTIKKYINIRSQLLQRRYGVQDNISISSSSSRQRSNSKASLAIEDSFTINAPRKGDDTISENYAFTGVHHIFDQHSKQVTMVKFANNDRSRLCCVSDDCTVSVCNVTSTPPKVTFILEGHVEAVTGCDWSASNDLIATCALDGMLMVWDARTGRRLRMVQDQLTAPLLCCAFQPANNNMLIAGNARGMVEVLNVSTGIYPRGGTSIVGGRVTALVCSTSGRIFWAANDKGMIVSYRMSSSGAMLSKLRRCQVGGAVSSLSWSPWLARHPALLVSVADNSLNLFRITESEGGLVLRKRFGTRHEAAPVRSSLCPLVSCAAARVLCRRITESEGGLVLRKRFGTRHEAAPVRSSLCPLVSCAAARVLCRRITESEGGLVLRKRFGTRHEAAPVRSSLCPLVSCAAARVLCRRITESEGGLVLRKRFGTRHEAAPVRSSLCPLVSCAAARVLCRRITESEGGLVLRKRFGTRHEAAPVRSSLCPLVSCAAARVLCRRITESEGGLVLRKRFGTRHEAAPVRSSFCPLMSFRRGVCVVSGSEDSGVYFYDVEGDPQHAVVNKLQGHAAAVLGVSFSYDESLLATSDVSGLVIIWRRR
ncbi:WD repeat-containing protein 13 [Bicyclus anynana]|uniref:WD repeat-containing protein 13 n=1 Tax=Bicyclus anynana TaxID=110368 RepID=A0ABM3LLW0_BICAN|nr:WD repeat-containing protein 13 [Bicyclus anynana]